MTHAATAPYTEVKHAPAPDPGLRGDDKPAALSYIHSRFTAAVYNETTLQIFYLQRFVWIN